MGCLSVICMFLFFVYQWHALFSLEIIIRPDDGDDDFGLKKYIKSKKEEKPTWSPTKRPKLSTVDGFKYEDLITLSRSQRRKSKVELDNGIMKLWLQIIEEDETKTLLALHELEFLVHQIENAKNFKNAGGIDVIFDLIDHEDPAITSAALSVLISAMQGNPDIQLYVEEFNVMSYFKTALDSKSEHLSKFISVISCYIRNSPSHQLEFIRKRGLDMSASILKDYSLPLKYKYKVIDLVGDLVTDIFHYDYKEQELMGEVLQRFFTYNANVSRICEEIPSYLQFKGFSRHEKVLLAMHALYDVCYHSFQKDHVVKILHEVKKFYFERKWYSKLDNELTFDIISKLNELIIKIQNKTKKHDLENKTKKHDLENKIKKDEL